MRRLPPDWAHILATIDFDRRMAIVAVGPENELIGVARYAYEELTQEAEIAIVVGDRWQGRGLGTAGHQADPLRRGQGHPPVPSPLPR
jgi:acetyltransferase